MPWPLPQPEMVNYCFGADLLDLQQRCILFHTSSAEAPVRTYFWLACWQIHTAPVKIVQLVLGGGAVPPLTAPSLILP
jgi:hypothetical protein